MSNDAYSNPYISVADSGPIERSQFVRRTYMHLAGAILAFIAIETAFFMAGVAKPMAALMMSGQYSWLIVMALFMGASWIADKWARSATSLGMQYAGLGLYVLAQAIIFVPILYVAAYYSSPEVIPMAAVMTLGLFLGLTGVVVLTKVDFSFLRGVLVIGSFVALGVIVASIIFGFNLGILFSGIMVAFAGVAILYNTSAIFLHYRTDQYVAASLSLFASVALLFWYILRIFLSRR